IDHDARGRSALARIVVYPGADHDFDRAGAPVHAAAAPEHGDAEARAASQKDVAQWLAR
nr:dienelactone hydrolase family protein [Rhizobium laguerreae]